MPRLRQAGPLLCVLLLAAPLPAQTPDTSGQPVPAGEPVTLPTDRQARKRLDLALERVKAEQWPEAVRALQGLLDAPEDLFIERKSTDKDGKPVVQRLSARAEADRVLGGLPAKGLEFYHLRYEQAARGLLDEARRQNDPQRLGEVVRRYFHTPAGTEATLALALYHLDRGRGAMAAACFRRLLGSGVAGKLSPLNLYHAVLAFRLAGDSDGEAKAWQRLGERVGPGGLALGGPAVGLDALRRGLDQLTPPGGPDWALFRGDPARSGRGAGDLPYLEPTWQTPTVGHPDSQRWLAHAVKNRRDVLQPVFPAAVPLALGGRVVCRTHGGVSAFDLHTGRELWRATDPLSLDAAMAHAGKKVQLNAWLWEFPPAQRAALFENEVQGALSSDGRRVFAVEELPLPPSVPILQTIQAGAVRPLGPLQPYLSHNRLRTIDAETGQVLWRQGGRGEKGGELHEAYFLGPPLPLAGKLYALFEKQGEIRLAGLDPAAGRIDWVQPLATPRWPLSLDPGRRLHAALPAWGDGILVCPTNAGAVLGVDLLDRRLLWAFLYHGRLPDRAQGAPLVDPTLWQNAWRASAPVLADGKIVLAPPDLDGIVCLDLRTGSLAWQGQREQFDLYVGGAHRGKVLVVGRGGCRALGLKDGKELWRLTTGAPAGLGAQAGGLYYLPLESGTVLAVDLENGRIVREVQAPSPGSLAGNEGPAVRKVGLGNLVLHEGAVLSQTVMGLSAFPQLGTRLTLIEARLAKDPRDPVGLTERGGLRLEKGDWRGAVEDLQAALGGPVPADLRPRARARLFAALTGLLQSDFTAGSAYLDEYRQLCQVPVPPGASAAERLRLRREEERRYDQVARLVAWGREQQGRPLEAVRAYGDVAAAASPELLEAPEDRALRSRADVWARGRIAGLFRRADAAERRALEAFVAEEWQRLRAAANLDEQERLVARFGECSAAGREARLELAELLAAAGRGLEAELHLLRLRDFADDPSLAARATEALARLLARRGLLDDALHFYRLLARDFAATPVRDGKAGADFLRDAEGDPRFVPLLSERVPAWQDRRLVFSDLRTNLRPPPSWLFFEPEGEALPFYKRHRLALDVGASAFRLLDRATGREVASLPVSLGNLAGTLPAVVESHQVGRYRTAGHLAVVSLGAAAFGLDLLDRRVLWRRDLLDGPFLPEAMGISFGGDAMLEVYQEGTELFRRPTLGPVRPTLVAVARRGGVEVLDPLRGTPRWFRPQPDPAVEFLGDDEYLFEVRERYRTSRVWRAEDGTPAGPKSSPPPQPPTGRLGALGRLALLSAQEPQGTWTVRLHDLHTGRDCWRKVFPPSATVYPALDPTLVVVVDAQGNVTALDVRTGQEVLRASVNPKHLEKLTSVALVRDAERFYLLLATQPEPEPGLSAHNLPLLAGGLEGVPVNGTVYAFDRAGKLCWFNPVPHQTLILDQFDELPCLLFATSIVRQSGGQNVAGVAFAAIDKGTGKFLVHSREWPNPGNAVFHTLRVDPWAGVVELAGNTVRARFAVK